MFNLDKAKEQLTKYSNKLSIGILGSVAAIVPQTAESQDRQIEEVGKKLRKMMPWITSNKLVDKAKN